MAPRERATHRSRGEKSRPPTVATVPAGLAGGRLPEAEWLSLLEAEQDDMDVGDILVELVGRVMDGCAKANAVRQRVPFTMGWVRDALLETVQCCFPARDEGETDPEGDGAWREDEEPETCTTDSWARGSVPVLRTSPSLEEGEQVSVAPLHGRQEPPTAAKAGGSPAQSPCPSRVPTVLPVPVPSHSEPLPDEAAIAPRPPQGKSPRARPPPPPRLALRRPSRPPAPCLPPGPAEPQEQGRWPWQSHGDGQGSSMVGVEIHTLLPPYLSSISPETSWPVRPPRTMGARREGSDAVPGVPWLHPRRRPQRWIRPQVEVLDVGTVAKLLARPQGARGHGRGLERGSWRQSRGLLTARGSLQPPSPLPRGLSSPLHRARPGPGVAMGQGGSVRRGPRIPARGDVDDETGEAKWEPRPLRAKRDAPVPGRLLTRRVRHAPT